MIHITAIHETSPVRAALRRLFDLADHEDGVIRIEPDPRCQLCTAGVGRHIQICAFHEAERALKLGERG